MKELKDIYMLATSDYYRLSHYLNPVIRGAPQQQVSVPL